MFITEQDILRFDYLLENTKFILRKSLTNKFNIKNFLSKTQYINHISSSLLDINFISSKFLHTIKLCEKDQSKIVYYVFKYLTIIDFYYKEKEYYKSIGNNPITLNIPLKNSNYCSKEYQNLDEFFYLDFKKILKNKELLNSFDTDVFNNINKYKINKTRLTLVRIKQFIENIKYIITYKFIKEVYLKKEI
jgi:hypothetical protein